jgi:hypothetical protein
MKWPFLILIFIYFIFDHSIVHADPLLSTLFNRSAASDDVAKAGLESGRFKSQKNINYKESTVVINANKPLRKKQRHASKKPASDSPSVPAPVCIPTPRPEEVEPQDVAYFEPTVSEQFHEIYKSTPNGLLTKFKDQFHPDDIRNNRLEIEVGSGYIYDSSTTSNMAYRNYFTLAPTLRAGGHVWMTPLVGITGMYESTFGESVNAVTGSSSYTTKSTWTEFSFDFRKFFGASRRANNIQYGAIFSQYKFDMLDSAASRISLSTSGFGVYLNSRIPVAPSYAWTFGFEVFPSLSHSEISTALALNSGLANTTSRVGVSVGGELKFNRSSQIIWTLGVKMERNQFTGNANMVDPGTGTTPNGVEITNTWSYLNLGYRWGQ